MLVIQAIQTIQNETIDKTFDVFWGYVGAVLPFMILVPIGFIAFLGVMVLWAYFSGGEDTVNGTEDLQYDGGTEESEGDLDPEENTTGGTIQAEDGGEWECPNCLSLNPTDKYSCHFCGAPKKKPSGSNR